MEGREADKGTVDFTALMRRKNASWGHFFSSWLHNPALILTVISNLAIFYIPGLDVRTQGFTLIWIYMVQSLMIGLMHVFKLWFYRFAPASRPADWRNPRAIAIFFAVHFGFFHFVYAFFIPPSKADWNLVLQGAAIFGFTLIINTMRHFRQENSGKYNANDFMFLPYVRIIPIHIAIILGGFLSATAGNPAPIFIVLVVIKIALELFLEYIQQLGVSFAEMNEVNNHA